LKKYQYSGKLGCSHDKTIYFATKLDIKDFNSTVDVDRITGTPKKYCTKIDWKKILILY